MTVKFLKTPKQAHACVETRMVSVWLPRKCGKKKKKKDLNFTLRNKKVQNIIELSYIFLGKRQSLRSDANLRMVAGLKHFIFSF
jgi:hypothetical protein